MKSKDQKSIELHKKEHTKDAIASRLSKGPTHSYLRDFIYGAIDGAVTTFAIVAGVTGAGLSHGIIIVLGIANLLADGFSMAVSNYLGTKAEHQQRELVREKEIEHIRLFPEGEKEEIRQIFANKGFKGKDLERAVEVITSDMDLWVNSMLQDEYGIPLDGPNPLKAGIITFVAFFLVGAIPLLSFLADWFFTLESVNPFSISIVLTALSFFLIGSVKSRFIAEHWIISGIETLFIGGIAAAIAYFVGRYLQALV